MRPPLTEHQSLTRWLYLVGGVNDFHVTPPSLGSRRVSLIERLTDPGSFSEGLQERIDAWQPTATEDDMEELRDLIAEVEAMSPADLLRPVPTSKLTERQ